MPLLAAISLLAPAMLLGATLVALPIIAHLLHRNARRPVVFPSIRLLRTSSASQSSLFRLRRRVLLLLRCLAVALLALAFAEPLWSGGGADAAGRGGTTVLVLDRSASTARIDGAATLFERLRGEAGRILESLHGGSDVAEVIVADDAPHGLIGSLSPNLTLLGGLLNELAPSEARADLRGAIRRAGELVEDAPPPHRVIVLTDGQASNWEDLLGGAQGEESPLLPPGTVVEVVALAPREPSGANVALEARGLSQAQAAPGQAIAARVRLRHFGAASGSQSALAREVRLDVFVDGVKRAERSVSVSVGRPREEAILVEGESDGPHAVEVIARDLTGDTLALDNQALFTFTVGRRRPIAILSDESPADPSRGTYFLARALAPYGDARDRFAPRVIATAEFGGASIASVRTLFVADVVRLGEAHVATIREHLARGGSVVWLCGGGALAENLALVEREVPGLLPFMPGVVSEREGRLVSGASRHELLSTFDDVAFVGLGQIRVGRVRPCTAVRDDAIAILAYDDGTPALSLRRYGEGTFALANFSASPKSGDLGRHGAFVALVQSLASELEASDGAMRATYVGETLTVACGALEPGQRGQLRLRGPSGTEVPNAFVLEDRSETSVSVERTERQGFYRAVRGEDVVAIAAVHLDPRESETAALDGDAIRTLISVAAGESGATGGTGIAATNDPSRGTPLWWLGLLGVLLAVGTELALLGVVAPMIPITEPILTIFLRPALPPVLFGAVAVGLIALAFIAYRRAAAQSERRIVVAALFAMRVVGLLAVLLLLLGPSHVPPTVEREERPKVTILLDRSESMRAEDCDGASRASAIATTWLAPAALDALAASADIEFRLVAERSDPAGRQAVEHLVAVAPTGSASNVIQGIGDALHADGSGPSSGGERMLLLSDGRDTSGASASPIIELARSRGIPIDTVCVGAAVLRRDLALQAAPAQEFLYANEEGGIVVRLQQTGLPLASVEIELAVNGPEGSVTARQVADLRGRTSVELTVPVRHEQPGQYEYTIRVAGRAEEIDVSNNVQTLFVDVSKAKARVLLLEGLPSWDMKFIAQSLRKDPRVELTQISRLSEKRIEVIRANTAKPGEGERAEPDAGSDTAKGESGKDVAAKLLTPESLATFDVFVLGKGIDRFGSADVAAAIRDRVIERGAAVIFARGRAYGRDAESFATAFAPLEPVTFAGKKVAAMRNVRIAIGASSATMPWMRADRLGVDLQAQSDQLAAWPLLEPVEQVKPATIVLARGLPSGADAAVGADDERNPPAIVSMRVGRGLAFGLLGEGAWRWALVGQDRERFEGVYERWVQGIVRWVASGGDARPGQDATLSLTAQSARLDESVGVEVVLDRTLDTMPTAVTLTKPDGTSELLPITVSPKGPLRLGTSFHPTSVGVHTVVLETPGSEPERQQRCVSVFDPSVERINPSADPNLLRTLSERTGGQTFALGEASRYPEYVRKRRFASVASQEATWVWNRFPILLLLCVWFGAEWILRRRAGLP